MAWTEVEDVLDRWVGDDAPTNDILVYTLITDAELLITTRMPDITDRIADDDTLVDRIRFVVSAMVRRAILNPGGVTSESIALGDANRSRSYADDDPFCPTSEEWAMLAARGTTVQRAFTINPAPAFTTQPYLIGTGLDTEWI